MKETTKKLRKVTIGNTPWYVAKDICEAFSMDPKQLAFYCGMYVESSDRMVIKKSMPAYASLFSKGRGSRLILVNSRGLVILTDKLRYVWVKKNSHTANAKKDLTERQFRRVRKVLGGLGLVLTSLTIPDRLQG